MTAIETACLYIALNTLILIWLSLRVTLSRFKARIILGDGGSESLAAIIRAHANATEYTPISMICLFALAGLNGPVWLLHLLGGGFTLGRVLHPFGMVANGPLFLRQMGMLLSWVSMLGLVAGLVYYVQV